MVIQSLKQRYSQRKLFSFFVVCAFPFHVWIIIMLILDVGWISQRCGIDCFIGVAALSLIYALVESVILCALLLVLSLLVPWKWSVSKTFTLLGFLAVWIPLWDMLIQGYRAFKLANLGTFVPWVFSAQAPKRYSDPLFTGLALTFFSVMAIIIWQISFNQKFQQTMQLLLDRISTLSAFYLSLDLVGIIVAVIRILD